MPPSVALTRWWDAFQKVKSLRVNVKQCGAGGEEDEEGERKLDIRDIYQKAALRDLYRSLPPLQSHKGEIRLMHLQPGEPNDPIICEVSTASRETIPEYEALSYTWSSPERASDQPICLLHINGILVYTLPNLNLALKILRYADRPRTLWIDYICINQISTEERNGQLRQMGDIYRSANRVILFLGAGSPSIPSAIQLLYDMGSEKHMPDIFQGLDAKEIDQNADNLISFLERPWFDRVWTIPEAVLSKEAVLVCGTHALPWNTVRIAISQFARHLHCCEYWIYEHARFGQVWKQLYRAASRCTSTEPRFGQDRLSNLLVRYRGFKATDPRDQVYSLLGMLSEPEKLIPPDYNISTASVFKRASLAIMKRERSVEYLANMYSGRKHPLQRLVSEIPSWAPDLVHCTLNYFIMRVYRTFSAAANTELSLRIVDDSTVSLKGIVVDTISAIDQVAWPLTTTWSVSSPPEARRMLEHLSSVESLAEEHLRPKNSTEDDEAAKIKRLSAIYRTNAMGVTETGALRSLRGMEGDSQTKRIHPTKQASSYLTVKETLKVFASMADDTPMRHLLVILEKADILEYISTANGAIRRSRFFMTAARRMGLGEIRAREGDKVAIFKSGRMPFLMRRRVERKKTGKPIAGKSREVYEILGIAYVDGIMDGEAVEGFGEEDWRDIYLV